ncbi:MAG TPA: glycosyltransferase family 4 protein [Thermoleophilaceae bacterium]
MALQSVPLAEGRAAGRAAIALQRGLLERGVDCVAIAPSAPHLSEAPPDGLPIEKVAFDYNPPRLRGLWDSVVHPAAYLGVGPYARRLKERAQSADIVHFVELHPAAALDSVDIPALVQFHCLTRRDRKIEAPWHSEGRRSIELLRGELRARRHAHWMLANSEEVRADIAAASRKAEVAVAPLALEPEYYEPRAPLDSPAAGVIGMAAWPPTANALERLVTRVWPRVLERQPDARLRLAGRGVEKSNFPHLPDQPGVEWLGSVPSAADFLRGLGLLLYPLDAGSGPKVKVLEAMALGIPIVTTPDGAEGIASHDGLAVETDDDRLADVTATLIADEQARRSAGERAYQNFIQHHTPRVSAGPVVDFYERMLR